MVAFDWRPWKPLGALEDEAVDGWCGWFHDVLGADEIAVGDGILQNSWLCGCAEDLLAFVETCPDQVYFFYLFFMAVSSHEFVPQSPAPSRAPELLDPKKAPSRGNWLQRMTPPSFPPSPASWKIDTQGFAAPPFRRAETGIPKSCNSWYFLFGTGQLCRNGILWLQICDMFDISLYIYILYMYIFNL